mgnify:FL=1
MCREVLLLSASLKRIDVMKRALKVALVFPVVVVWDISFFVVSKLYEGMSFVDEKGGKIIENFLESRS